MLNHEGFGQASEFDMILQHLGGRYDACDATGDSSAPYTDG